MPKRTTWLPCALCVGLLIVGCAKQAAHAEAPAKPAVRSLMTFQLHASRPTRTITLPGELSSYESVSLYPRAEGFLSEVYADKGSVVKHNDVLALIEAPDLEQRLSAARAKADAAAAQVAAASAKYVAERSTYARLSQSARVQGVVSAEDLTTHKASLEAAAAEVAALRGQHRSAAASARSIETMKRYLKVTAPFDGVISERFLHPGALVGPGSGATLPLFKLVSVSRLRLSVAIPEANLDGLSAGQRVSFTVPAYPESVFHGTVARLPHALEVKTRSEAVELDVPNPDARLAAGMYAEVSWPFRRVVPTFFVPASAICSTTERTFVERVRRGAVEWVDVRTGGALEDHVEVFGPLEDGDALAVKASEEIRAGMPVIARPATSR